MSLRIDDSSHNFDVVTFSPLRQNLEFGPTRLFTTLASGQPIATLDANLQANIPLFNNANVVQAVGFIAECVVLMRKDESPQFPEQFVLQNFEFGFVQGLKASNVHLDYWGRYSVHGRTAINITMPSAFDVDTDTTIAPWTRAAADRFKLRNVTMAASQFNSLRIRAEFNDHPMYAFGHTVNHPRTGVPHFIRSVTCKREFETVFCFREKKTGTFTPINTGQWILHYNHQVVMTGNGSGRSVTELANNHQFPTGGSPSAIGETARTLMKSAKAGAPIVTAAILNQRISSPTGRVETVEDKNEDFDASFWT